MPHLPRFRRHRRTPPVKSLPEANVTGPPPPPPPPPPPANPPSPSRRLFPSRCVPCLKIPPPPPANPPSPSRPLFPSRCVPCLKIPPPPAAPATTASPQSPTPTKINATSPPTPASPANRSSPETPNPATCAATPSLLQPARKRTWRNVRILRFFCSPFRSLPIIAPTHCKLPSHHGGMYDGHIHGGIRMTGTLFGHRKARITLAVQENSRCLPMLLLEMAIPTGKLLQEMSSGLVRIALECEKRAGSKTKLTEEPVWTMYCNGRKTGYGSRREATEDDLHIMQLLHAVSMGAGVLPNKQDEGGEHPDGELTYMRAFFERVIGSKDSETFYMLNPDGNSGPELSIFFVRI